MKALRAIGMAFALYSRIPMPNLDWESESRRWLLCAFPLVGIAVGGAELLWLWLARLLGLSGVLQAAVLTAIPLLVTGESIWTASATCVTRRLPTRAGSGSWKL